VNLWKLVENLATSYEKFSCNTSLRINFLHSHLDSFLVYCGAVRDKHGECFHQDISAMENRCKGKWIAAMLASYCWMVKKDAQEIQYKQEVKKHLVNSCKFTVMSCFCTVV
jgi:hypothetical protein